MQDLTPADIRCLNRVNKNLKFLNLTFIEATGVNFVYLFAYHILCM